MDYQATMLLIVAVTALQLICSADARTKADITYVENCDPGWTAINVNHSMCMVDVVTPEVLDQATKDAIVKKHNDLRAGVDPKAADMAKVIWDDDVAAVAAKWASQCIGGHDGSRGVTSLPGIYVGQNGAFGYGSWDSAVQGWYNEVQYFVYGVGSTTGNWANVGHYTQVVQAETQRIGCGLSYCSGVSYYFCNYAYGQMGVKRPYQNSTSSCSACPNKCDSSGKLCDCGGRLCLNGGTLDMNTCACSCQTPLYSGDICEILNCPALETGDSWVCGPGNQWPPDYCTSFSNVKYSCPYMCGVCPHECGDKMCYNGGTMNYKTCQCTCTGDYEGDMCQSAVCEGKKCQNGGTLDKASCNCNCYSLYTGDTCQTLNCPALETGDSWVCGPGNQWPPDYCKYSNVPPSCPYMCGVCPHECGDKMCYNGGTMNYKTCQCTCTGDYEGDTCQDQVCGDKKCQNGGALDKASCTCSCSGLYTGDTCQTLNCPALETGDSWVCGPGNQWPPDYCKYSNVPPSCPYMCGVCPHECGDKMCYHAGTMNYKTCQCTCSGLYIGDSCQTLNCPALETGDSWVCGPGNQWPPDYCKYSNVPPSCPYMCGVCSHECEDKMCYNGGTMNYKTCQCTCASGWDGDMCKDKV